MMHGIHRTGKVGQVRGTFHPLTGDIMIADDPTLSSFEISIDTTSIDTRHAARDEDLGVNDSWM